MLYINRIQRYYIITNLIFSHPASASQVFETDVVIKMPIVDTINTRTLPDAVWDTNLIPADKINLILCTLHAGMRTLENCLNLLNAVRGYIPLCAA